MFKNQLEQRVFEIAQKVCGEKASIEHNKTLRIEIASTPETASFVGPPKKEIDVITAGFANGANLKLLISCKDYGNSPAEPAHIQEWVAVVSTMTRYSATAQYLGLVFSPSGFTRGCEPWASSHNLGLIPPLKGKNLKFKTDTCLQMFERTLTAFGRRLNFPYKGLLAPPTFYEFVYELTEAFEGRDKAVREEGARYRLRPRGWLSSFSELIRTLDGKTIQKIATTSAGIYVTFSDGLTFRVIGNQIEFGPDDGNVDGVPASILCEKNFPSSEGCSMDFMNNLVIGQKVVSAGDWGNRFEFGLTDDLMLAIEHDRLQVYRTRNPVDLNLL